MGSFLSSAADDQVARILAVGVHLGRPRTKEEQDALDTSRHVDCALAHYNFNNPGPEFYSVEPGKSRAACVGFKQDFWYHVGFLARRTDEPPDAPVHHFFAELRLDHQSRHLIVETCTILGKPRCRYRRRCAFCPDKFEILHPREGGYLCGKKGHRKRFFRERNTLGRPFLKRCKTLV